MPEMSDLCYLGKTRMNENDNSHCFVFTESSFSMDQFLKSVHTSLIDNIPQTLFKGQGNNFLSTDT